SERGTIRRRDVWSGWTASPNARPVGCKVRDDVVAAEEPVVVVPIEPGGPIGQTFDRSQPQQSADVVGCHRYFLVPTPVDQPLRQPRPIFRFSLANAGHPVVGAGQMLLPCSRTLVRL